MYRAQGKLPDRVKNAPVVLPGLGVYMSAFYALDRERSIGFNGREFIKQRDIKEYAYTNGFSSDQCEALQTLIPQMDNAFLRRLEEKKPKK